MRAGRRWGSAFTLIELLVVIAILSLLMAMVTASLVKVRVAAKSFVCKNKLKNVAFDFILFADDYGHPWRGDSDQDGKSGFRIEDFQERLYGIGEFWKGGPVSQQTSNQASGLPYKEADQPLMCPCGPDLLYKNPGPLSTQKSVTPHEGVSIGFNMRLDMASVRDLHSPSELKPVRLSKRIMEHPAVPLAFDVDGQEAAFRTIRPYYSAPADKDPMSKYAPGAFWFPSQRHGGKCNAAFVGGHVLASVDPVHEGGWDWDYQPPLK